MRVKDLIEILKKLPQKNHVLHYNTHYNEHNMFNEINHITTGNKGQTLIEPMVIHDKYLD